MNLFIPRRNALQHKMLGLLVKKLELINRSKDSIDVEEVYISTPDLMKQLNISASEFMSITSSPFNNNELGFHRDQGEEFIYIGKNGDEAYHEKKYLRLGRQLVLNQINDFTKIIIPLIAIILSIVSFYISMTDRINNRRTIDNLKVEIQLLQSKIKK